MAKIDNSKFEHINTWLFDLDHTLFPASTGIVEAFFECFYQYLVAKHNFEYNKAVALTKQYYAEFGNPLLGFKQNYNRG